MAGLLDAARKGDEAALRAALEAGDPDGAPSGADSALCLAAMFGHPRCVELLIAAKANVNHTRSTTSSRG